jgi:large subunit ribosomal protein L36
VVKFHERRYGRRGLVKEGAGMKVRNSLKALKAKGGTQVVRRRGRTYLISRTSPRLKARQG